MKRLLIFLLVYFICSSAAVAEIYKWRDENGKLHFSDTPPVTSLKVKEITVKDNIATGVTKSSKADVPIAQPSQIGLNISEENKDKLRISADSYKITKTIETDGEFVTLSGRIGSGPRCENLRIEAFAINENGRRAHLTDMASIGSSNGSALFNARNRVFSLQGDRSDWKITSFYVRCSD